MAVRALVGEEDQGVELVCGKVPLRLHDHPAEVGLAGQALAAGEPRQLLGEAAAERLQLGAGGPGRGAGGVHGGRAGEGGLERGQRDFASALGVHLAEHLLHLCPRGAQRKCGGDVEPLLCGELLLPGRVEEHHRLHKGQADDLEAAADPGEDQGAALRRERAAGGSGDAWELVRRAGEECPLEAQVDDARRGIQVHGCRRSRPRAGQRRHARGCGGRRSARQWRHAGRCCRRPWKRWHPRGRRPSARPWRRRQWRCKSTDELAVVHITESILVREEQQQIHLRRRDHRSELLERCLEDGRRQGAALLGVLRVEQLAHALARGGEDLAGPGLVLVHLGWHVLHVRPKGIQRDRASGCLREAIGDLRHLVLAEPKMHCGQGIAQSLRTERTDALEVEGGKSRDPVQFLPDEPASDARGDDEQPRLRPELRGAGHRGRALGGGRRGRRGLGAGPEGGPLGLQRWWFSLGWRRRWHCLLHQVCLHVRVGKHLVDGGALLRIFCKQLMNEVIQLRRVERRDGLVMIADNLVNQA
mmetsp:Transcript_106917/g.276494  ORF Transcript_106917/g.276494 Transcript_106917/m.276494 type:complete len:530 (+) Transcript_106917:768-2357(+)